MSAHRQLQEEHAEAELAKRMPYSQPSHRASMVTLVVRRNYLGAKAEVGSSNGYEDQERAALAWAIDRLVDLAAVVPR